MRWFINSTKESAGFNDNNNVQAQIGALHTRIDSQQKQWTNHSDRISDSLHDKGIQINNILKHQGSQDERIDELERKLQYALHKIDDFLEIDRQRRSQLNEYKLRISESFDELEKRITALENQSVPKQSIPDEKPKRERIANSYADEKYSNAFKIAMGYWATGMKQEKIADKLNAMNIKTPTGKSFHQGNVSDLLANRVQKQRFMAGKDKKAFL